MSAIAVGEITIVDLHDEDVHIGPTPPDDPKDKKLWLDTSTVPNVMKRWDATNEEWIKASPTDASDIGAETPEGAQDKADDAEEAAKDHVAVELGYVDFADMMQRAQAYGKTLIMGGYLNTEMVRIGPETTYEVEEEYTLQRYQDMTLQELTELHANSGGD